MSFREKIDKILKTNKLGINSVYALEVYIGASPGAINKYYKKEGGEPGHGTIKKILDLPGLNDQWFETGKGEVFIEKPTPAIKGGSKEEGDLLDHPLVKSFVEQINLQKKVISMLENDLEECNRKLSGAGK